MLEVGITAIPADDAAKLQTETLQIPGSRDYLVQLGVFHQLHCLNALRKALYPERYKVDNAEIAWNHWGELQFHISTRRRLTQGQTTASTLFGKRLCVTAT